MGFFRKLRNSPRRSSLSRRLIAVVLAAVGTGMIVSVVTSAWQQSLQYAQGRRELLLGTAHVFSAAVAQSAWDRDESGAFGAIRAIGTIPNILYAEVQTREGTTLATLGGAPRLVGDLSLDGEESLFALFSTQTIQV